MNELTITDNGFDYSNKWDLLLQASKDLINAGVTNNGNPTQVAMIIVKGRTLGLGIFESLENVFVVNNKTSISTDLAVRLVEKSGLLVDKTTVYEGEGDTRKCVVTVKRKDRSPATWSFSIPDAKQAKLFERRTSPWATYPDSMLYARAMGYAMKREFSDVLGGNVQVVDEIESLPEGEKIAVAREVTPEPPKPVKAEQPPDPDPFDTAKALASPIISDPSDLPPQTRPKDTKSEARPSEDLESLRSLAAKDGVAEEVLIEIVNGLRLFPRGVEHTLANLPELKIQTLIKNWVTVMRQVERLKEERIKQEEVKARTAL